MKTRMHEQVAEIVCNKPIDLSCEECFAKCKGKICEGFTQCRILEKTQEQIEYVISSTEKNTFLRACAGSGKTEVVGLKAAYEIKRAVGENRGIAVLSFTNDAVDVIRDRVAQFLGENNMFPHFIGTLSSFIYGYIVQPFAYKQIGRGENISDYSINVIDENVKSYSNHFLTKYKCEIEYFNKNYRSSVSIYAHQIGYNCKKKDWYINLGTDKYVIWISEFFSASKEKNNFFREGKNECSKDRVTEKLIECKHLFWKDGFASFEDMNLLAIKVLRTNIADEIVKRFPFILIDECQDLSDNELCVIELLQKRGCHVHFIGDINQSIYGFKQVNPENIQYHVAKFKEYKLSTNFRSCKEIVDCSKMIIEGNSLGQNLNNTRQGNSLVYIEYNSPDEAVIKYSELLDSLNFTNSENRILVKQNKLKQSLTNSKKRKENDYLITALQLWINKRPNDLILSLELAGNQISRWFGSQSSKKNYFCPTEITSVFAWRIFLMNVLDDMEKNQDLCDFNVTYSNWYEVARTEIKIILENRYGLIADYDTEKERNLKDLINGNNCKAKRGFGKKMVMNSPYKEKNGTNIPIITIHGSKGCTFDTTLVISSQGKNSKGGYWKHWFEGTEEDVRIGYVAFTRAKYLLVLGVPKLNEEERNLLQSYGFVSVNQLSRELSVEERNHFSKA